ncbi:GNAT family N-acetyltransferase [Phreatobacter oligotrophus]|uniref:RimJ/RimL family protein N-acetyltransferase n=1 Tax=Phreatobacter oligotrophus TaxID=1122261 RepID=A0A2T4ZIV6_9HYPH|nr:GNAT family protein [Phreatobacter oligotrophus]PTM61911.1 hypothetical protein C8P69_101584 [Phreatobacter oligotrophus]
MTSELVYHDNDRLLAWAVDRMGYPGFRFRQDAHAIGRQTDGEIRGVVIFDTWSDGDCLIHVVSDGSRRWFTREFCVHAMAYPFLQVGNRRITALVSEHNDPSLAMCRHFGFAQEGRLRRAGPAGEDMILFGLLREDCRWLKPRARAIVRHAA